MNMRTLLLAWLLLGLSNISYAAVTITTPTVNSGELIRASDWNKVRSDLITISSAIDILSNQLWNSSGGDMYYTNGQVGVGTAVPPAQFSVHKESPAANEKLFQIGTGADADKANIDEDGDLQIDGTLLVRGGTVYDSSGALELNGEDNVYISMDWNNNDNDNRALIIGKNAPGPGGNWAELMKIQENGRVGIGVSSPTTELEVNGRIQASVSNGTDAAISSVSTVTNGQGVSGVSSGQNGIGVYGNAMGQYGIGIYGNADASAEYSTSIYGMNYSTTGTAVRGTAQASSGYVFGVWGESYSPNGVGVFAKSEHPASTPLVVEGNNSQTGDLAKFNSGPGTTVLTVNASGKVGIGTTNPSHALQVVGDMKVNGGASDDGLIISNATDSLRIKTYAGAQDTARFSSTGGGGDMMTLNLGNGNIGIGTTAPSATLDIGSGGLRVREGIINKAGLASGTDLGLYSEGGSNWIRLVSNAGDIRFYVDGAAGNSYYGGTPSMTVAHTGNVGIGTTAPSQKLDVEGTVLATDFVYSSDKRLKKDILKIKNPIKIIQQLEGVKFKWNNSDKNSIGFIAQDVERVLPELVETSEVDGLKSVRYGNINAILVEALKEMKELTDQQQKLIENQQEQINKLKEVMNL